MIARYASRCTSCPVRIEPGDDILMAGGKAAHASCVDQPVVDTGDAPAAAPVRDWSPFQQAIFERLAGSESLLVDAVAGSGKTSTIVEAANRLDPKLSCVFLAFNKSIATELQQRLPSHVKAATFHAHCFGALQRSRQTRLTVDANKVRRIAQQLLDAGQINRDAADAVLPNATKLVGLAKAAGVGVLASDSVETWAGLVDYFALDFASEADTLRGIELARQLYAASNAERETIDFDDMLLFTLADNVPFQRVDVLFVDEAQDTSGIQRALMHRMVKASGRVIAVGDPFQAIYGFRGASSAAMALIGQAFDCVELPLSISYRCPRAVVQLAQSIVPQIQAAPTAPEGEIVYHSEPFALDGFAATDAVLCRTTAPIISLAYRLLGARVPCRVLGREIGKGLTSLIKKLRARDLSDLEGRLDAWRVAEVQRFTARFQEDRAQAADDKAESIYAAISSLPAGERTIPALVSHIESLFTDNGERGGILTLCTVHKAKGLEWPRVFILQPELMPSRWAKQVWQQEQERNLMYVAYTRAQQSLHFLPKEVVQ